jgi:hypothetical protein
MTVPTEFLSVQQLIMDSLTVEETQQVEKPAELKQ